MNLRYDEQIYVFEQWCEYDSGGMTTEVFKTVKDFSEWINKRVAGQTPEKAKEIINGLTVIRGSKVPVAPQEIITEIKVSVG